jgi:hypothetical protein
MTFFQPSLHPSFTVLQDLVVTQTGTDQELDVYWVNLFVCPWFRTFDGAVAADALPLPFTEPFRRKTARSLRRHRHEPRDFTRSRWQRPAALPAKVSWLIAVRSGVECRRRGRALLEIVEFATRVSSGNEIAFLFVEG